MLQALLEKLRLRRNSRGTELTAEQKQELKRQAIRVINAQTDLTPQQKQTKIQAILLDDYVQTQSQRALPPEDETKTTYYNEENKILGCKHYMRGCRIRAPCCGRVFGCRLCHDEQSDHAVDRRKISEMICMHCKQAQPCAKVCRNPECNKQISRYYCDVCHLFDDQPDRDIYHCPHCGICRRGRGLDIDFYHCIKCNTCLSVSQRDDHTCIERALESNCPICDQYMFTSVHPVLFLRCGHPMHQKCYNKYITTNYVCPLCNRSLFTPDVMASVFAQLEAQILAQPTPEIYQHWKAVVLCNDCLKQSTVPFHFLGHKCTHCGSFNTKSVKTIKDATDTPAESSSAVSAMSIGSLAASSPAAPFSSSSSSSSSSLSSSSPSPASAGVSVPAVQTSSPPSAPTSEVSASGSAPMSEEPSVSSQTADDSTGFRESSDSSNF